jgi:hypothetical protein
MIKVPRDGKLPIPIAIWRVGSMVIVSAQWTALRYQQSKFKEFN